LTKANTNRGLVSTLNLARGLSALYVVASHTFKSDHSIWYPWRYGGLAVMVFFVLSGFVIYLNESSRVLQPAGYYFRRFRRIYPMLIISMTLSAALYFAGFIEADFNFYSLVATLLCLADNASMHSGTIAQPFLDNGPLWSLSFEVAYYLAFPYLIRAYKKSESLGYAVTSLVPILGSITYTLWPNHLSIVAEYLAVWWIGAALARSYMLGKLSFRSMAPDLFVIFVLIVLQVAYLAFGLNSREPYPFDYLMEFSFTLILTLICLTRIKDLIIKVSSSFAPLGNWLAGISYAIYVFHRPLFIQTGLAHSRFALAGFVLLIFVSWIVERLLLPMLLNPRIISRSSGRGKLPNQ
jgi:peptidoglycan/LPS O-acetylase OafA/YrhL